jgi:hypothetical protein
MAATKALSSGDWAASYNFLAALPVWGLMPRKEEVRPRSCTPVYLLKHEPRLLRVASDDKPPALLPVSVPPLALLAAHQSATGAMLVKVVPAACICMEFVSKTHAGWCVHAGAGHVEACCLHL